MDSEEEEDEDSDEDDSVSNGGEALDDSVCPPSQCHTSAFLLPHPLVTLMLVGCFFKVV